MRDKQNNTSGYSCGFFQAMADCFSQCFKKKRTQELDYYSTLSDEDELFNDSNVSMASCHAIETPRLANKVTDGFQHIQLSPYDL